MFYTAKDITYALRMLARNPSFTVVATVTLAFGIGANTAIFSVVDSVLLKPLPFRSPDRLAMVWQKSASGPQLGISELDLDDYRTRNRVFESLGGFSPPGSRNVILTGVGNPVEIAPAYVTRNYFSVLGISPQIGRDFLPVEDLRGRNNVAILGFNFWQARFARAQDIVGRQITLNQQRMQVVGVMGPDVYPVEADVFVPFTQISPEKPLPRNYHLLHVVGRLRPGRTVSQAQREMDDLSAELEQSYPATNAGIRSYITPLREEIVGKVREPILMLLAAVGLVLLIACGNVANLLLVRAAARQKEIAIRAALGAGRPRIMWQFISECLLLTAGGALLGLLLAYLVMPVIRILGAARVPRLQHVTIDARVLLFACAIALLTGLLFGIFPALRYSSANLNQMLRAGGRSSHSESGRMRNVLVAGEVALALMVVVGASLLLRSLDRLLAVQPGFRTDHLLVARVGLPPNQYKRADVARFYHGVLPRIAGIPSVISASAATSLPLASEVKQTRFAVQGAPLPEPGRYPITAFTSVDTQFFATMGIPILRGRVFRPEEVGNLNEERCIINDTLARRFFGGQNPIGRNILVDITVVPPEACQIVGVAGDTRVAGLDAPNEPVLYFASYAAREMLVVRTTADPLTVAPAIQREIAAADPQQPLSEVRTMDDVISQSISRRSFAAVLLALFAGLGLILAALGLYGVVSYSVAQRTQEIGVRMALGAEPGGVFRLILSQGLRITGIGLAIGVAAAAGVTRWMSSLLFGLGATDPLSFAVGCVLLLVVAVVACYVPAHRAMKVDPLVALRYE